MKIIFNFCFFLSSRPPTTHFFIFFASYNINICFLVWFPDELQQVTVQLEHREHLIAWQTVSGLEVLRGSVEITQEGPSSMQCISFRLGLICASCASVKMAMRRFVIISYCFERQLITRFDRHVEPFYAHHHRIVNPFKWAHHAVNLSA